MIHNKFDVFNVFDLQKTNANTKYLSLDAFIRILQQRDFIFGLKTLDNIKLYV